VLDASARDHETVLVSAGRRGLDVEVAPDDLVTLTSATVAAIAQH
jgi:Cys-tRNA(Pro)/Cys-tRNA(Cys) deacylase